MRTFVLYHESTGVRWFKCTKCGYIIRATKKMPEFCPLCQNGSDIKKPLNPYR